MKARLSALVMPLEETTGLAVGLKKPSVTAGPLKVLKEEAAAVESKRILDGPADTQAPFLPGLRRGWTPHPGWDPALSDAKGEVGGAE